MPSFPSISNGQLANGMRTSYISQTAFNNDFFQYTTTQNPTTFVTTGALSAVTGATSGNCPAGRVLRDNGKRLYPSAHPGVSTYMVGVFDPVSFLSGYIDPNSPVFAVYNGNKPAALDTTQLAKGVNPNGGGADLAPTVYTAGNIETTAGNLLVDAGDATVYGNIESTNGNANIYGSISANNGNITADIGNITATAGNVVAAKQIRSTTVTALAAVTNTGSASLNPTLGQTFTISTAATGAWTFTFNAASVAAGSKITIIITATTVNNTTFSFGTNMYSAGTLTTTAGAGPVTQYYTISFVSDGTNFYETARTAAQT